MAVPRKLAIPRVARDARFENVQKTFPLSSVDAKKIDAFVENYLNAIGTKKEKEKEKRSLALVKG